MGLKNTEDHLDVSNQYQLENKSLKAEIEQLQKERLQYQNLVEESRALEERYKLSQVKFRTIFEQSRMGNKILDSDLKIVEVNEALIKMLGYTVKKDVINRKILDFAHPDFIDHWNWLQKSLWGNKIGSFSIDTCLVKKDQSALWCHVTSILFEDEDNTLGYTIIEDITERKLLEEKIQRLLDAQQMVSHTVAHDLRNPIHTIQILVGFLRKDVENKDKEKHLRFIEETCNRSQSIINDLILIGELEGDTPELIKTDLGAVITTLVEAMSYTASEKAIRIDCELPTEHLVADVDNERLGRAIENLLSNAIKFSSRGGEIKIVLEKEAESLLIKVIDQGIGIPSHLQSMVFNRFTKAGRKGTEGEETIGLGLYIAKRVVESHKGKIWLESKQNEGATFFVRIPM